MHTKGPWSLWNDFEEGYKILGSHNGDGNPGIADVRGYVYFSPEERKANALLIASAPELLDAVMELANCDYTSGTHLYTAQQKAKSAIEKATGQPFKLWFEK